MATTAKGNGKNRTANRALVGKQKTGKPREPMNFMDVVEQDLLMADGLLEPLENIDYVGFSDRAIISLTMQARARIREARHIINSWSMLQGGTMDVGPV
jgi:hypothetical protein